MLIKPFLARCDDRTSMPKLHPTSGTPEEWFSNSILQKYESIGFSFDFFIDWSKHPSCIVPVVWVKRILRKPHTYNEFVKNLNKNLTEEFGLEYITRLSSFASICGFQVQLIVYRDDFEWQNRGSEILLVTLIRSGNNETNFEYSVITIDQLKEIIKKNSGGPVKVGSKGLIYGTSRLECYLSKTDSLYPGDVDLIVLDARNKPKAILEFKKHTLQAPISDQKLSNYYPYPDGRKYDRLAILQDFLIQKTGDYVPLLVLYYPTQGAYKEGRMELLQRDKGKLSTRAASNFDLPTKNSISEYDRIVRKLENAIVYSRNIEKK